MLPQLHHSTGFGYIDYRRCALELPDFQSLLGLFDRYKDKFFVVWSCRFVRVVTSHKNLVEASHF